MIFCCLRKRILYIVKDCIKKEDFLTKTSIIPQSIFMLDDTIEANIAFGVSESEVPYFDTIDGTVVALPRRH